MNVVAAAEEARLREGARGHAGERSHGFLEGCRAGGPNMSSEELVFCRLFELAAPVARMWMSCVQLPRRCAHTAQNVVHRFCEKPVFFTFLRIRAQTHPSSCFDKTDSKGTRKVVVPFFHSRFQACNTPWHQESAAKWWQEGGRNRAGGLPPFTTRTMLS